MTSRVVRRQQEMMRGNRVIHAIIMHICENSTLLFFAEAVSLSVVPYRSENRLDLTPKQKPAHAPDSSTARQYGKTEFENCRGEITRQR